MEENMELTVFSTLLAIIGFIIGVVLVFILQAIKNKNALNKADKLIENAQKEAEKIKRDNILEIKEESFKLKQETEKEIKEKKWAEGPFSRQTKQSREHHLGLPGKFRIQCPGPPHCYHRKERNGNEDEKDQ